MDTEGLHVFLALRGEDVEPMPRVLELGNVLVSDVQLLHDFVLCIGGSRDLGVLFYLFRGGLVGPGRAIFDFAFDAIGRGLDGHSCAVEAEGEEHSLT